MYLLYSLVNYEALISYEKMKSEKYSVSLTSKKMLIFLWENALRDSYSGEEFTEIILDSEDIVINN